MSKPIPSRKSLNLKLRFKTPLIQASGAKKNLSKKIK